MRKAIILLFLTLSFATTKGKAQEPWERFADTLMQYGATLTYVDCDSLRTWFARHEQEVGYERCYHDFHELVARTAEQAKRQDAPFADELRMSCQYMAWQKGEKTTEETQTFLQQTLNEYALQHGDTTKPFVSMSCILASFYCRTGQFAEVDSISMPGRILASYYFMWHQDRLVSKIGQGQLEEAFKIMKMLLRASSYGVSAYADEFEDLREIVEFELLNENNHITELLPQILIPILPPTPSAFRNNDIAPWPFQQTLGMETKGRTNMRNFGTLTVFNFLEILSLLNNSTDHQALIDAKAKELIDEMKFFSSAGEPIAAEQYRRSAEINRKLGTLCDTISHPHNKNKTDQIMCWRNCINIEQLYWGKSSAVALLSYATEWIRKGYPYGILDIFEEGVEVMHNELNDEKPTSRTLLLQKQDSLWLARELPELKELVGQLPEYATLINKLQEK